MVSEKHDSASAKMTSEDVEAEVLEVPVRPKAGPGLKRQMKVRHITMIRYEYCASDTIHSLTSLCSIGGMRSHCILVKPSFDRTLQRAHWDRSIFGNSFHLTNGWSNRHVTRLPHYRINMLLCHGESNYMQLLLTTG